MLNPKTNRMIKKESKIGRKLIKEQQTTKLNLSELINDKKSFLVDGDTKLVSSQVVIEKKPTKNHVEIGEIVNIVSKNVDKFKNIDDDETDKILRKLIKKKLKKTGRYKSDSDDDSD